MTWALWRFPALRVVAIHISGDGFYQDGFNESRVKAHKDKPFQVIAKSECQPPKTLPPPALFILLNMGARSPH